jgi:hypothetical protein
LDEPHLVQGVRAPRFGAIRERAGGVMMFPGIVPKLRQAQTFLATIGIDVVAMKILAVISILALLTISGAAYTDQLLTSDQETAQRAN